MSVNCSVGGICAAEVAGDWIVRYTVAQIKRMVNGRGVRIPRDRVTVIGYAPAQGHWVTGKARAMTSVSQDTFHAVSHLDFAE